MLFGVRLYSTCSFLGFFRDIVRSPSSFAAQFGYFRSNLLSTSLRTASKSNSLSTSVIGPPF